jgi:hypothetical protein
MGVEKNIKVFEVPRSTIKNKFNVNKTDIVKLFNTRLVQKPVLPYNPDEELISYCIMIDWTLGGGGATRITRMAFELAIKDGLAHSFSVQQGRENWKGLHNFMCCHPRLRLRMPRFPSAAKVKRFTKENVAKFFDTFESFLRLINFSPHSFFSYDETGLTVVQHNVC